MHALGALLRASPALPRIRTNECLGRAQEVALAAHASTEALAGGAELKASRTCTHPLRRRRHPHESHRWWRRGQMAEAVREGTAPAVLGSGGGVDGVGGGDGVGMVVAVRRRVGGRGKRRHGDANRNGP